MTETKRKKLSFLKAAVIAVAVIVVLMFVAAVFRINDYAKSSSYGPDARDYIYPVENARFGDLYDIALHDMDKHADYSEQVLESRALAFYYEQAVLEHAYRESGDTEKADRYAARMKEYEAQLGSLSSKTKVVQERLGM